MVSYETDLSDTFLHNFIVPILSVRFGHDEPRFVAIALFSSMQKRILYPAAKIDIF